MSVSELEEERAKLRANGADPDTASVADRAAGEDEYEEELFPLGTIEGDEKTIKNLIASGARVKVTASLTSANVPMRGGLPDPNKPGQVMVSHEPAQYILIPQREGDPGDKRVVGWEVRCKLRSTYTEPGRKFYTREQVVDILHQLGLTGNADRVVELLGPE